ncbi:iron ABC transporter permease [Hyphomicrobium nitrativorans NL23]|uniref:Iron ABC transporter permease n=1 Tax=Hyphomicrobium nitrativorans NL23 TaxID=1029756 RepID=V5SEL2_9HYPH|nr:iron ABC transporter permease [Hyphomicrobium nitrativorans NL23]
MVCCLGALAGGGVWAAGGGGFAGLGEEATGFAEVTPGRTFFFPADLGAHPDYRIEWWYVTANLKDAAGEDYGVQWTLFRQALEPGPQREGWASQQVWMGHAGLTSRETHRFSEAVARGGIGQAGVSAQPFAAWIDDWTFASDSTAGDGLASATLSATGADFSYALTLKSVRPMVLQGDNGYSVKSDHGQASYYYSQPFFDVSGRVTLDGREIDVTGRAWMDREWSSQPLAPGQKGWDWFSLHLPDGEKLMLFQLRSDTDAPFYAGTWIAAGGHATPLDRGDIVLVPLRTHDVAGRQVPVEWSVEIESRGLRIATTPLNPESWMATSFAYWEGPVRFTGTHDGEGYLEMTGY